MEYYILFKSLRIVSDDELNDSFIFLTCATDTDNMEFVLDSVRTIIMCDNLRRSGFLGSEDGMHNNLSTTTEKKTKPPTSSSCKSASKSSDGNNLHCEDNLDCVVKSEETNNNLLSSEKDTTEEIIKIETKNNEIDRQCNEENISPSKIIEEIVDFTMIPKQLDQMFETHDKDGSVRSTILKTVGDWKRRRQDNLLSVPSTAIIDSASRKDERNKAIDLLDALSRSGSLPISSAELHVIVAVTHSFENDIMGTIIQDSINPIEKVEKTILILASTIHGIHYNTAAIPSTSDHRNRLMASFPELFQKNGRAIHQK